ncbi:2-amino-4-hydroxy-6-hydroxymethyldihydropteridine diphosphokinase [Sphingomonas sp.]|uniref:2-amino-4-hydroxy-6- hydroxymethyldihydropteridine diphosphokinase n=1 Tax=Sphingomonas sp. TaxID=28214 RepID=UPI0025F89C6A|nr:2-amino-4-hydroxy-6-hydroxymethyldihydropteridine diphosphokinase [Sphingomonas sp.]
MIASTYLIGIGSNRCGRAGSPRAILAGFLDHADPHWGDVLLSSDITQSAPVGPGKRNFANAVAAIETMFSPTELLSHLKSLERIHGRRGGRRWGDRVIDLDIIAWSGGIWSSTGLTIPHPALRKRRFVLAPLCEIAPGWRDPVTNLTARHLLARLDRRRPRP